jgi:CheY-like chemotaxis protein
VAGVQYDLNKLTASGIVNAKEAAGRYYTYQEYFDGLSSFLADEWPDHMCLYNPTVVIYSDEKRKAFLHDCVNVRAMLSRLGLSQTIAEVNKLEDAVYGDDVKLLSDGLVTFRATLAIAAGAIRAALVPEQTQARKPLIMLVSDKPAEANAITAALWEHYNVVSAQNGEEAIKSLPMYKPELFILETDMPFIGGYELALMLREQADYLYTPVMFVTSDATSESVAAATRYRYNTFLKKPLEDKSIRQKTALCLSYSR